LIHKKSNKVVTCLGAFHTSVHTNFAHVYTTSYVIKILTSAAQVSIDDNRVRR
jgi:hypothetical protein